MILFSKMYLTFSDAAKFADIARNFVNGNGYGSSFTFFGPNINSSSLVFPAPWVPPVTPLSIALFFKIFGTSDFAVIFTSVFFFALVAIFTFLLGRKLFGNLAGTLAALVTVSHPDFIKYSLSGASEPLFTFEIVASFYFVTLKKKWAMVVSALLGVLMYFTRPQAFIFIAGLVLYYLLLNFKTGKALTYFILVLVAGLLVDYFLLTRLAGRNFLYSVTGRGLSIVENEVAGSAVSDSLRGITAEPGNTTNIFKKIFYNLYNYYKLLPQIVNPYLSAFFLLGIFKSVGKDQNSFKVASLFVILLSLLVSSASIPFFRYIHPVVPVIYIIGVATLVWTVGLIFKNNKSVIITSILLTLFFAVAQALGVFVLDSRFERRTHNVGKPPVYVVLSKILKENTNPDQVIVTNLDTWGSWYGERKTVWFPLEPSMILNSNINAIYLTSYLIDDENYYMGENWRKMIENPKNQTVLKDYKFIGSFNISANENYERQDANAVLFIKQ